MVTVVTAQRLKLIYYDSQPWIKRAAVAKVSGFIISNDTTHISRRIFAVRYLILIQNYLQLIKLY